MTTSETRQGEKRASNISLSSFYLFASFFSGVVVMLVEITGVRLISPIFGNSIYTWTALIAVVYSPVEHLTSVTLSYRTRAE